ncbi:LamG-like jellyroll fold domain-containing protein [Lentisalinibacter orientalis]|uniref:LamG-like jellyroll fold domain-containing protein n=1 Tax=Lentisalinibacter orientalis TaxID=2992241 RepID=UPI003869CC90
MNKYYSVLLAVLLLTGFSVQALAGPCDAYYRFDGNLSDESGNGNAGQMIGRDGAAATAEFVEGRSGQALKLDGSAAMRAFVDLNRDRCPQATVTAWIKIAQAASQTILGTGSSSGPWLWASGSGLFLRTAGKDLRVQDAIYANGGWMFVAAVWDHKTGTHRLHWHGRQTEQAIGTSARQAKPAIWLGANNDSLHHAAKDLVIDELRIIGSALDAERIMAMRDAPAGAGQSQTAMAGTAGQTCSSHAGCAAGSYCGMDGTCHPDSHRPMQNAGGGTTLQDLQASSAERNAGIADTVDYESPTDLLQNAGSGEAGGTGESGRLSPETEQAIADRVAENRPPEIKYASEEEAIAAAERREQERLEEERRRAEAEAAAADAEEPKVIGWRLSATDVYQSPVSGKGGEIIRVLDMEDRALSGIEIFEPNNVPCYISLEAVGDRAGESLNECTQPVLPAMDLSVWNRAVIDPAAVNSMRVCHSFQGNDRVKGVAVSGNIIEADGSTGFYQQGQGDGPNCSQWQGIVYCNAGDVASGIVAHFKDRDLSESLTGLQLVCRKIQKIYE